MHRATPANTSWRSYDAGGCRTCIDKADDAKLMQEMSGNFMKGESREGVECPQNYGFTSVVMPAKKNDQGQIDESAEGFISFMGGNRSFPVCTVMDDRRHRLKSDEQTKMEPGDSAMYRTKEDKQQFHLHKDGNYLSSRDDRKNRIALVKQEEQQQGGQGQQGGNTSGGGGGQGGQGQQGQGSQHGQTHLVKQNNESKIFFEQTKKVTTVGHNDAYSAQRDTDSSTFIKDRTKSTQVTSEHSHLRTGGNRIFTDSGGCWSTQPILQKKDGYCKE